MKNVLLSLAMLVSMISAVAAEEGLMEKKLEKAVFAGGCFWCMESPFEDLPGVKEVISGYCGGTTKNPTYEQVSMGVTGHTEAVLVTFDPAKISYEQLLDVFWRQIDPTQEDGQFVDRGSQYRTGIFYYSEEQKRSAEESRKRLEDSGVFGKAKIVTEISPATDFWPAEEYHQNFCRKKPGHYKMYREGSGRDRFLERIWGKDSKH